MIIKREGLLQRVGISVAVLLAAILFMVGNVSDAQGPPKNIVKENTLSLNQIRGNLEDVNAKRANIMHELETTEDEDHRESLELALAQLNQQKRNFEKMFEKTALGGLEVELYDVSSNEEEEILHYDWQKELIKIVQPVFSSLQNLTESQRKRDFIRTTRAELQNNLLSIDDALLHLSEIHEDHLSESSIKQINKIRNNWEIKRAYYANQLELINLQYREIEREGSFASRVTQGAWDFLSNQGKTLLLSIGTFFGLLYLFSWVLRRVVERHEKKLRAHRHVKRATLAWRLMLLLYEIFSFVISFTALLVILHSSGDMVLFGFAILIILAMIISLRNSIPAYFQRLRTFLNMGLAREGERVVYQGIPWEIEHINLYSVYLVNPSLDNGRVRLTIDYLEGMVSRDVPHDEAYYPTNAGDTVLIEGIYATIIRQTPETIYLNSYGAALEYGTEEFAARKPLNITTGYIASTQFILNRSHAMDDIEKIIADLKIVTEEEVAKNPEMMPFVTAVHSNYRGLNLYGDLVFGMSIAMGPNAEGYYNSSPRFLQRCALIAVERFSWQLPDRPMMALPSEAS